MPTISSSASTAPAFQQGFAQLKIQQAKRNAEQAEANARTLQAQAADAQRNAQRAQESARDLTARSDQAPRACWRAVQGALRRTREDEGSSRLDSTPVRRACRRVRSPGGLSERPMDLVLKTSGQQCPVGSNPTPSAESVSGPGLLREDPE